MRDKIFNTLKLIISLLLFFSISVISIFILKLFNIDVNKFNNNMMVIYQLIVSLVMFVVLFIIYYKNIKEDYKKFKENISSNIKKIIKLFLIFIIIKYIVSFITILIMTILKIDANSISSINQSMIEGYVKSAPILMVINTVILAPMYEEILFRLGFKKVLNKGILFVIISGFIFGILHVFPLSEGVSLMLGIVQSISYVTMGIVLANIYNKTDNIFISIGVHFLNNLISILTIINIL